MRLSQRRRRRNIFGGSILPFCYRRMNLDFGSVDGGGSAPATETPAADGGLPQTFEDLSNLQVEEPTVAPTTDSVAQPEPRSPADPNQRGAAPVAAPTTSAEWQSAREFAMSQLGYQFPATITDDAAALRHLVQQAGRAGQSDFYAQLGRQLAPQAPAISQYIQQQRTAAPATPERQPWEAPEFDQRWAALVEQDPTSGMYVSKPGADPIFAQKVNAYVEWKQNYDRNPAAVINGMVEQKARAIAQETFREQFQAQARQNDIQSIVHENSSWLYATDQAGQRIVDPVSGQFAPSPVGARYIYHVQSLKAAGVSDPRQQDSLAKSLVRGEYAQQAHNATAAAAQQATNPQTSAAMGHAQVNPLGAVPPTQRAATPGTVQQTATGLSLHEMLTRAMAEEGITDAEFATNQ